MKPFQEPRRGSAVELDGASNAMAECHTLAGVTGKVVQVALFLICCGTLLFKYHRSHGGRSFNVFLMDSSKQLIGSCWIHLLNLLFAQLLEQQFEGGGDECDWYWVNIVIDTTLGVACTYVLLRLMTQLVHQFLPDQVDDLRTGDYNDANGAFVSMKYVKQVVEWLLIVSAMKICMVIVMFIGHTLFIALASAFMSPFAGSAEAKLLMAMIVTPCCMNALQYWVTDNFIKKQTGGDALMESTGMGVDIETDGHGASTRIDHGDL